MLAGALGGLVALGRHSRTVAHTTATLPATSCESQPGPFPPARTCGCLSPKRLLRSCAGSIPATPLGRNGAKESKKWSVWGERLRRTAKSSVRKASVCGPLSLSRSQPGSSRGVVVSHATHGAPAAAVELNVACAARDAPTSTCRPSGRPGRLPAGAARACAACRARDAPGAALPRAALSDGT